MFKNNKINNVELFKKYGSKCFYCENHSLVDELFVEDEVIICYKCCKVKGIKKIISQELNPTIVNIEKFNSLFSIEKIKELIKKIDNLVKRCYCCGKVAQHLEPFLISNKKELNLNKMKIQLLCNGCLTDESSHNFDFEKNNELKKNKIKNESINSLRRKSSTKNGKLNTLEKILKFTNIVINNLNLELKELKIYRQSKKSLRNKTPLYIKQYEKKLQKRVIKSEIWFMELWKIFSMDKEYRARNNDQYNIGIGSYIPDVINYKYSYIIEIDGSIHDLPEQKEKDKVKQNYYERKNFKVFRIKHQNLDQFHEVRVEVLKIKINHAIKTKEIRNLKFLLSTFFDENGNVEY